ncbi:MAG: patatin-like phospholipase family protein [Burkholderiales bacterium]|nr:patatin-like phospholipase family protein [Burkholderiales bacterium]
MSLLQTLGLKLPGAAADGAAAKQGRTVRFEEVSQQVPEPGGSAVQIGKGRQRSDAVIAPPPKVPAAVEVQAPGGKKLEVVKAANGKVKYTAPPPKVAEITFSGGGGKGTALPGAVKALHESGILKDATKIAGASVGSMTAALVAAGITPDEMLAIADADETTDMITEGTGGSKKGLLARALKNKILTGSGSPLTGQGLEDIVRNVLDETLRKRMAEYMAECSKAGKPIDPAVARITARLASNKAGPTFGDYRALSKVIPAIKEVVMTGSYTTEFTGEGKGKKKLEGGNEEGQLYVFDADSEPDLEVAVAVHASASFPGAFKPIDIKIASGLTVRFIDGGVMNNTPTSSSIGNERDLDPMPQQRGVTFVFDDDTGDAASLLKGKVNPAQGLGARIADWFVGSKNAGAEYAKNKSAADKPGEIVVVPLQIELPPAKPGKKGKKHDLRGTLGGTLNFSPPQAVRDGLRGMTEEATKKQIAADGKPRTREFASDAQMFASIPLDELKALAASPYAGAAEAVAFRERVAEMIVKLLVGVKKAVAGKGGRAADALKDKDVAMTLAELDTLAGAEPEFQGYVGRELNRKPELDLMLEAARRDNRNAKGRKSPTLDAADAVAEGLRAHTFADNILKQLVYPKMKQEPKGGAGILTLFTIEQLLRTAKQPGDVNQAIELGVKHFLNKRDRRIPKRGHRVFAQQLAQRRMRPAA